MLPRLLCEELCSLNPNQERLSLSFIWKMTEEGEVSIMGWRCSGSIMQLTLCLPSSTIGTAACSPNSTFGTDNGAFHNELNPIVLHLCTQWHCLELSVNSLNPHCQLLR